MNEFIQRAWRPLAAAFLVGLLAWWLTTPRPPLVVDGPVLGLTPDGQLALLARGYEPGDNPHIEFLDPATGAVVAVFRFPQPRLAMEILADGTLLAYTSIRQKPTDDFVAYQFNPRTQVTTEIWRAYFPSGRVNFSANGRIAIVMNGPTFHEDSYEVWDLVQGSKRLVLPSPFQHRRMSFLTLTEDGRFVAAFEIPTAGADESKPYCVWLWDLETGELRDRLELPADIHGRLRQPARSGWLEMEKTRMERSPTGTSRIAIPEATFFDLSADKPFARAFEGLAIEPDQKLLLTANPSRDVVRVQSITGQVLSPPIPVEGFLVSSTFVPRTSFVTIRHEAIGNAPRTYQFVAKLLGLPLAANSYWGQAAVLDWRTGQVVLSCPNRINPYERRQSQGMMTPVSIGQGVPAITIAANGRRVAFTYETESGWRTEIWPLPPPERSWVLIMFLSAAAGTIALGTHWAGRDRPPEANAGFASPRNS